MCVVSVVVVLLCALSSGAFAITCNVVSQGLDVADPTTAEQFTCEANKQLQIASVRVGSPDGKPISTAKDTIKNAISANFAGVHYSLRLKFDDNDVTNQVKAALDASGNPQELSFPIVWIDVVAESGWGSDVNKNTAFLDNIVKAVKAYYSKQPQLVLGIYTTQQDWKTITGDSQKYSGLYLFWSHDGSAADCTEWDDGKPNGNWQIALMKEYQIDAVDADCQNVKFNKLVVFNAGKMFMTHKVHNVKRHIAA